MIYIARDGAQHGPYPIAQINAMLAEGQLRPADLAWWQGCAEWVPVMMAAGVVMPQTIAPVASVAPVASPAFAPIFDPAPQASVFPGLTLASAPAPAPAPASASAPTPTPASVYAAPRGNLTPGATMAGQVSAGTVQALKETRPWVRLIAIVGMVMTGIMLIAMLAAASFGFFAAAKGRGNTAGIGGLEIIVILAIALLMGLLYIYPIVKLFKYAGAISRLHRSGSVKDLEDALGQQKSFWKFAGILTLIVLLLNLLVFIIALVGGGGSAFLMGKGSSTPSAFPVPAAPP